MSAFPAPPRFHYRPSGVTHPTTIATVGEIFGESSQLFSYPQFTFLICAPPMTGLAGCKKRRTALVLRLASMGVDRSGTPTHPLRLPLKTASNDPDSLSKKHPIFWLKPASSSRAILTPLPRPKAAELPVFNRLWVYP